MKSSQMTRLVKMKMTDVKEGLLLGININSTSTNISINPSTK